MSEDNSTSGAQEQVDANPKDRKASIDFLWKIHDTLYDNIKFADAKAIAAITLVAALTGANLFLLGGRLRDIPPSTEPNIQLWASISWVVKGLAIFYVCTALTTFFCALAVLMPRSYSIQHSIEEDPFCTDRALPQESLWRTLWFVLFCSNRLRKKESAGLIPAARISQLSCNLNPNRLAEAELPNGPQNLPERLESEDWRFRDLATRIRSLSYIDQSKYRWVGKALRGAMYTSVFAFGLGLSIVVTLRDPLAITSNPSVPTATMPSVTAQVLDQKASTTLPSSNPSSRPD